MAEDGKIVYKIVIDDSGAIVEAERAGKQAGEHFSSGAGTMENVWTGAARRIGEAFVDMAAKAARSAVQLITGSIETGMEFDAAMSQVAATLGYTSEQLNDTTTEEAKNFQDLTDFAMEMGRTTAFTASQAAEALNYMALAGYTAEDSMTMLPTVLNLAAAGAMDLGRASDAVTDIQTALGLTFEETIALVDQMARTSQKTNTSVAQLAEAMLTVGGNATVLRGGTVELTEILGIMASAGIKGAEAGTHLRNVLLGLSGKAKGALADIGVAVFDTEGKMKTFSELMPEIAKAMEGMTDEEMLEWFDLAFNIRDITTIKALLGATEEKWEDLADTIEDSQGAAEAMAETQLDNLAGDVTKLKSAWEGFQIELARKFTPVLREIMPQLIALVGRLTESLINADWSKLGDIIVNIADKAISFLEYLINHGDEVLKIVESVAAVLLGGKITSLVGGLTGGGGGVVSGVAKKGASAVASAFTGGAGSTALSVGAGAALPLSLLWGLGMGVSDYAGARKAALADATLGDDASIAEMEANVQRLQAAYEEAERYYQSRQFELYSEMEPEDGWHLSEALAARDAAEAALRAGESELETAKANAEQAGLDTAESYADGLASGSDSVMSAASSLASGVMSILGGAARSYVEGRTGYDLVGAARTLIEVPVMLNSREIARATAWDMGEQMAWEE